MRKGFIHRLVVYLGIGKSNGCHTLLSFRDTRIPAGQFSTMTDSQGKEELGLYRLDRQSVSETLPHLIQLQWLAFYLGKKDKTGQGQPNEEAFFVLCDDNTPAIRDIISEQVSGVLLLVAPHFLSEKTQLRIEALRLSPKAQQAPFAVPSKQRKDLNCMFDKIESLIGCDYRFKKDYIGELVIQLIHILLKGSGLYGLPTTKIIS